MENRKKRIMLYTLAVIGIGFIVLTLLVYLFPQGYIDIAFSAKMQRHRLPWLDVLMNAASWPGDPPVSVSMAIVGALLFRFNGYSKEALYLLLTLLTAVVSTVVKFLIDRPRPAADVVEVITETSQKSFPSGHTQFYVVFFGFLVVLMYNLKQLPNILRLTVTVISLALIFIIPFSRVYLGAHWFTDVVGGFLLGLICLGFLEYFYLRKPTQ